MTTSVVAPLVPAGASPRKISRLHPVFQIDGAHYVLATHLMSSLPNTVLSRPPVEKLDSHHHEIVAALDMLFLGY